MTILNKSKPRHVAAGKPRKPTVLARIIAMIVAVLLGASPATALAAMNGYDVSNWQCGINTAAVPGDFVVVGTTWGTGGFSNSCLANGVNTDANRQLQTAMSAGKRTGVYHYAMGGNPEAEAQFFVDNVRGYVGKSILVLDWEQVDNPAWGDTSWPRRWAAKVKQLTGVNPIIYVQDSAYWQVAGMEQSHNTGIWIAQYASMDATGYQASPWNNGMRGEVMRQYTSSGVLPGWSGRLDLDIFNGTPEQWDKYVNPNGDVQPLPQPDPGTGSGGSAVTTEFCVTVASGDTVSGIAQRTGHLPWTAWRVPSGDAGRIYPGDRICYGGTGTVSAGQSTTSGGGTYTVKSGDCLSAVFGSRWPSIAALNGLVSPYTIYPGQVLKTDGGATTSASGGSRTVTVRSGDTLSGIAQRLGVSMSQITGYRSGNPSLIYPGEVLHY